MPSAYLSGPNEDHGKFHDIVLERFYMLNVSSNAETDNPLCTQDYPQLSFSTD